MTDAQYQVLKKWLGPHWPRPFVPAEVYNIIKRAVKKHEESKEAS